MRLALGVERPLASSSAGAVGVCAVCFVDRLAIVESGTLGDKGRRVGGWDRRSSRSTVTEAKLKFNLLAPEMPNFNFCYVTVA